MKLKDGMMVRGNIESTKIDKGMIRIEREKFYFCQNLENGVPCRNKGEFKYSWEFNEISDGTYTMGVKLIQLTEDIENVYEGAIIANHMGRRKVLGICGKAVFISHYSNFEDYSYGTTIQELKRSNHKIILPEEGKVSEKSETIKVIGRENKMKKDIKATDESIEHHEENLEVLKRTNSFKNIRASYRYTTDKGTASYHGHDCPLCKIYISDGCCNECPLYKFQGDNGCNIHSTWGKLETASSLYEAICAEEGMIKVLKQMREGLV